MLNRLRVQNYKCLLDATVDLGGFTVLIGANDSGKSSFLEVIQTLGRLTKEPPQGIFTGSRSLSNLVWRKDAKRSIVWEVTGTASGEPFTYRIELPADQRPPSQTVVFKKERFTWPEDPQGNRGAQVILGGQSSLAQMAQQAAQLAHRQPQQAAIAEAALAVSDALASTVEYRFEIDKLCEASVPEPDPTLHESGDNLASVLDALLTSPDQSAFSALERALHDAVPTVQGLRPRPVREKAGAKAVEFILAGNGQAAVTIPATLASGGALLLTAFLTLAYGNTPGLLLLEEPENGLHPSRLELVINTLRKLTTGEIGNRKRQVIVTTHSPLLLNYLKPDEVRILIRDIERGTQVTSLAQVPDIDQLIKEFGVGELWYMLGEEKLVEGKRA